MLVNLIEHWGSDLSVVNAARVSFDKKSGWVEYSTYDGREARQLITEGWTEVDYSDMGGYVLARLSPADTKLVQYLAQHKHTSCFEHMGATLKMKVPIFIARQIQRHRTFSYNEISRRYVDSEPEFYIPDIWRKRADNLKQGSTNDPVKPVLVRGVCGQCGAAYTPTSPRHHYCSQDCQQKSWRERNPMTIKWRGWKASADRRGYEFSITEADLDYPKYCPYLGLELQYEPNEGGILPNSASLDRIDPTLGYVPGNVQIISNRANSMKLDASEEELVGFAKNVLLRHRGIVVPDTDSVESLFENIKQAYMNMIANGVAPEQARMILPQATYTEFYMTGNLRAWAHFLHLRLDGHAQLEVQQVAQQVADILTPLFPVSMKALMENHD